MTFVEALVVAFVVIVLGVFTHDGSKGMRLLTIVNSAPLAPGVTWGIPDELGRSRVSRSNAGGQVFPRSRGR